MEVGTQTPNQAAQLRRGEKLVNDLKRVIRNAEETAKERAKAADRTVRAHPYEIMACAFGVGLLVGLLARRK